MLTDLIMGGGDPYGGILILDPQLERHRQEIWRILH